MSLKHVAIAGLVAGVVLNAGEAVLHGVLLAGAVEAATAMLGRSATAAPQDLPMLLGVTFLQGLVGMWIYSLLVPRMKRLTAAALAGLTLWALSAVYAAVYIVAGLTSFLPNSVIWWPVAWAVLEYPLAILMGSFAYRGAAVR